MSKQSAGMVLDYFARNAFYTNLYFQGEPFMNQHIFEIIQHSKLLKYYTVTSTNGHFLSVENCERIIQSGLDELIISVDGYNSKQYEKYRVGGKFEKVISGIKRLSDFKKKMRSDSPLIVIQCLVNKYNEADLQKMKEIKTTTGANKLVYKSMQIYSERGMENFKPTMDKFNRYGNGFLKKRKETCYRLWSHAVITSDRKWVACCYDKTPSFIIGKIDNEKGVDYYWQSSKLQKLRKNIMYENKIPEMCRNCIG